jgi:protein PhnA
MKGSAGTTLKKGTKVKRIRLAPDGADGHDVDCKIDGVGAIALKSQFLKKIE